MAYCVSLHDEAPELGLVLTGGGARAAYQVGVLKGIAELVAARFPLPVSGHDRHLRRRGERHRPRLGSGAFQTCGLLPSSGCGAISACTT